MEDTTQVPHTAPRNFEFTAFEFTGRGSEYFRIWIVNLVLTILTLGIFSAWAKVRRLRYFYGHTRLDGHAFDYLADPKKILKGRILAVILLFGYSFGTTLLPNLSLYIVFVALLLIPLVIATASAFMMRNSAYRNIRFSFRAAVGEAYNVLLPPLGALAVLVAAMYFLIDTSGMFDPETGEPIASSDMLPTYVFFGVLPLLPWLDFVRMRFVVSHARFGNLQGMFGAGLWDFYKLYLQLFGMVLLAIFVGAILIFFVAMFVGVAAAVTEDEMRAAGASLFFVIPIVLVTYSLMFIVAGWFAARRGNLLRNSSRFGDNRLYGTLQTWDVVGLYLGNLVLIILTLGMYIPFAAIRLHRYNLQRTAVDANGIDEVVAVAERDPNALGEEIGEFFDVDLGL